MTERVYLFCCRYNKWFMTAAIVLLLFSWSWGLAFVPADSKQGDGFRIIYLHVPAASWSMGIYLLMALCAFICVVWQKKLAEQLMIAMAPIGMAFTLVTLITGSIWGSVMWGTWWEWDARLTSELILLFLYLGVIALYDAFEQKRSAGKIVAMLVLVGVINLPIIHFSVEWWNTLHQPSTGFHQTLAPIMRPPLRLGLLGYGLLFFSLVLMRLRNMILQHWLDNGKGQLCR